MLDLASDSSDDSMERRIFAAMDSPPMWKTIDEIAQAARLPRSEIALFLLETEMDIVESAYANSDGQPRYSTRSNFERNAPWWIKLRGALSDSLD